MFQSIVGHGAAGVRCAGACRLAGFECLARHPGSAGSSVLCGFEFGFAASFSFGSWLGFRLSFSRSFFSIFRRISRRNSPGMFLQVIRRMCRHNRSKMSPGNPTGMFPGKSGQKCGQMPAAMFLQVTRCKLPRMSGWLSGQGFPIPWGERWISLFCVAYKDGCIKTAATGESAVGSERSSYEPL